MIKLKTLLKENSFDKSAVDNIRKILEKVWRVKLPRKKFHPRSISFEIDNNEVTFRPDMGILVIQNWDGIPKVNKLATELKKVFGDVHVENDYINARDYGEKYEEFAVVENPKTFKSIPKINKNDLKKIKTKGDLRKYLDDLRDVLNSREATIKTKNVGLKLNVIKKYNSMDKVVEYNKDYYYTDGLNLYYAKNRKEAEELAEVGMLIHKILRYVEVSSWDVSRMGPEGAFD